MDSLIIILFFAIAYAVKGGSMNVLKNWDRLRDKSKILDTVLDGKILSTLMVFVFSAIYFEPHGWLPFLVPLAWLAAVAPSMGEEHGAVGDYKGALPVYLERAITKRGRLYDAKKALQRGVWMGACMTLATGSTLFILTSLLFIPAIWVGQSINLLVLRQHGWTLAEPIIGASVFGLAFLCL